MDWSCPMTARLSWDETSALTENIVAALQTGGSQTLPELAVACGSDEIYVSRVLDILVTTPLVSVKVSPHEDDSAGNKVMYTYCEGKVLPYPVKLKTLLSDINEEMKAISNTYESLGELRKLLLVPPSRDSDAELKKYILYSMESMPGQEEPC